MNDGEPGAGGRRDFPEPGAFLPAAKIGIDRGHPDGFAAFAQANIHCVGVKTSDIAIENDAAENMDVRKLLTHQPRAANRAFAVALELNAQHSSIFGGLAQPQLLDD